MQKLKNTLAIILILTAAVATMGLALTMAAAGFLLVRWSCWPYGYMDLCKSKPMTSHLL